MLVTVATGTVPGITRAQSDSDRIRELERRLERSVETIEALGARVRELEARTPTRSDAAPAAPKVEEHPETTVPDAGAVTPRPPTVLRGFADVGARYSGNRGNKGVALGSIDFYITPQLSENVKALIELVVEYGGTGAVAVDLERLQLGYTVGSSATAWLGRFHTPLGYWNTAFNHGQQIQTSILRPQMVEFEDRGGMLPVRTVGLLGTGAIRAAGGKFTYDLYAGNAPSIRDGTLDPNNSGNRRLDPSSGFNLGYQFAGGADGLKVGLHGYRANVRDEAAARVSRLNILGGYAAIDSPVWEVIAEYYRFRNENLTGGTGRFGSWAGFAQVGRRIERWTPYGRLEKAVLNQADNYFGLQTSGRSYSRQAIGLRYELTPESALKLELNRTSLASAPPASFNQWLMQWAIRF